MLVLCGGYYYDRDLGRDFFHCHNSRFFFCFNFPKIPTQNPFFNPCFICIQLIDFIVRTFSDIYFDPKGIHGCIAKVYDLFIMSHTPPGWPRWEIGQKSTL